MRTGGCGCRLSTCGLCWCQVTGELLTASGTVLACEVQSGARLGALQFGLENQGSLGMVFRAVNPLQMLMPILNLLPGAIGAVLYYSVYADTLASTAAAISRAAKAAKWSEGGDPLVIDLDGDGMGQALFRQGLWRLVPRAMQCRRPTALHSPRSA